MRNFYLVIIALLALCISATAQRRLIKATVSGNWTTAGTWTTTGLPTIPTNNDSIVIGPGITVTYGLSGGISINLQNIIVDIFGTLFFVKPTGASKSNDLTITTTNSNPVPIVRLASAATITASSTGNGSGNIFAVVNSTTTQTKYSTASVSPAPLPGQTAGPTVTGAAFAQNTSTQPLYFTSGSNAALPLSISLFKGDVKEKSVALSWTSLGEINTKSFLVEKSTNGSSWQQIGLVAAAGFSTVATKYQFVDGSASAVNFYRLSMIDLDGKVTHSNTLVIRLQAPLVNISLFPNPAVNSVNISMNNTLAQQPFTLNLLNHNGQVLARRQIAGGASVLSFDLTAYKTGSYTLDIQFADGTREAHKLAIVK